MNFLNKSLVWSKKFLFNPFKTYLEIKYKLFYFKAEKNIEMNTDVKNFCKNSDAIAPCYDDLYRLYDYILKEKPKFVLEYGSGFSTYVMATALLMNKKKFGINGKILSIEGIQKWAQNTKKYLSDEQLKFTEILVEKPEVIKKRLSIVEKKKKPQFLGLRLKPITAGILSLTYTKLHHLKPDMIYIDGPSPKGIIDYQDSSGKSFKPVLTDLLYMEKQLNKKTTVFIDCRITNTLLLTYNLKENWKIKKYHFQGFTKLTKE